MILSPKMYTGHTAHGYGLMGLNLIMEQGILDLESWHSSSQDSGNVEIRVTICF